MGNLPSKVRDREEDEASSIPVRTYRQPGNIFFPPPQSSICAHVH